MNGGKPDSSLDDKSRENTGRWTREEHNLFLKGLEMHGKGWKKIASLIKSRTVVQIRTHAQKYFLKMHKARQDGDVSGSLNFDGKTHSTGSRKLKKKKLTDLPVSLAPHLKPYIRYQSNTAENIDVDDLLYNFLSPNLDLSLVPSTEENINENPITSKSITINENGVPRWYENGEEIDVLVADAEKLNWLEDPGEFVPSLMYHPTNTMNPEVLDGSRPYALQFPQTMAGPSLPPVTVPSTTSPLVSSSAIGSLSSSCIYEATEAMFSSSAPDWLNNYQSMFSAPPPSKSTSMEDIMTCIDAYPESLSVY